MDYRRMAGSMEQHLANATATTSMHQLRHLWKSPRGTVLRIEALALVAIALSFFLAIFGSCRRWSDRWIVQKGFLAANVLSLSLGTYSIGLMQSSSMKSQMYPVWAVSLLTLFGCVDPITSYNGLDYKSPLFKIIFQLSLYCGYVMLMSISNMSSNFGNIAIGILSIITFIKGLHRSLALVLPSRTRRMLVRFTRACDIELDAFSDPNGRHRCYERQIPGRQRFLEVDLTLDEMSKRVDMGDIHWISEFQDQLREEVIACHDVCLSFSLSHSLHRRFLGLTLVYDDMTKGNLYHRRAIDFKWALKVIEVELAFVYDIFFTGNEFLHYYQAKTASIWAFASFMGICLVGVATAIPGTMTSHRVTSPGPGACTIAVDTTMVDLIVTLVILVSLALLQLVLLIRCWTSNWARVAFACDVARKHSDEMDEFKAGRRHPPKRCSWWMRLRGFLVTRINWFDTYLWQDKLGQYSIVEGSSRKRYMSLFSSYSSSRIRRARTQQKELSRVERLTRLLGLQYVGQVLWELGGGDIKKGTAVRLDDNVKAAITEFLDKIQDGIIGEHWSSVFVANGISPSKLPYRSCLYNSSDAIMFSEQSLSWHIATCYCELAEDEQEQRTAGCEEEEEKNRGVAIALSKYYAYLVVSVPELLPGPLSHTEELYDQLAVAAEDTLQGRIMGAKEKLEALQRALHDSGTAPLWSGVALGMQLLEKTPGEEGRRCTDHWKVLAQYWVQALLYAAPFGNVEAHMQHLSQGGEFITHLYALLHHIGIYKWERQPVKPEADNTGRGADGFDSEDTSGDGGDGFDSEDTSGDGGDDFDSEEILDVGGVGSDDVITDDDSGDAAFEKTRRLCASLYTRTKDGGADSDDVEIAEDGTDESDDDDDENLEDGTDGSDDGNKAGRDDSGDDNTEDGGQTNEEENSSEELDDFEIFRRDDDVVTSWDPMRDEASITSQPFSVNAFVVIM